MIRTLGGRRVATLELRSSQERLKLCSLETKANFHNEQEKKANASLSALSVFDFGWFLPNGHV
jgi:hypothetical protein